MRFRDWFEGRYRKDGEGKGDAIQRLCVAAETNHVSVYRALKGEAVSGPTASRLVEVSGGKLDFQNLVLPPPPSPAA